jgi:hypothetical protein
VALDIQSLDRSKTWNLRFFSQASYRTEVNEKVIWGKLKALVEGARLATTQLWEVGRETQRR